MRAGNEVTRGRSLLTPVILLLLSLCLISILAANVEPDQNLVSFVPSSIFLPPPLKSGNDFHAMTASATHSRQEICLGQNDDTPAAPYFTDTG